jgi:hypothetical protein
MKSENRIEEKIDAVRDKLCAETAHMSRTERTAYFRALAEDTRRQYSITPETIPSAIPTSKFSPPF